MREQAQYKALFKYLHTPPLKDVQCSSLSLSLHVSPSRVGNCRGATSCAANVQVPLEGYTRIAVSLTPTPTAGPAPLLIIPLTGQNFAVPQLRQLSLCITTHSKPGKSCRWWLCNSTSQHW